MTQPTRPCPDGHGPMERQPGFWAFQGVERFGGTLLTPGEFALTGKGLVCKLWACPVCQLVRVYADDQGD